MIAGEGGFSSVVTLLTRFKMHDHPDDRPDLTDAEAGPADALAGSHGGDRDPVAGVLADMEPDLQLLSGMLVALRTLGAGQEPVEQSAIAALARLGEDTMERVQQGWRSAYRVSLRGRQQR